jgi:hypothetical protein
MRYFVKDFTINRKAAGSRKEIEIWQVADPDSIRIEDLK